MYFLRSIILSHAGMNLFFMSAFNPYTRCMPQSKSSSKSARLIYPPAGEDIAIKFFAEHVPHIRIPIAHVCSCETGSYDFPAVIARQVEFEAVNHPIVLLPSAEMSLNTLLKCRLRLWRTGIIVPSTKLMPGHFPNARIFMDGIVWKNTRGISSTNLLYGTASGKQDPS